MGYQLDAENMVIDDDLEIANSMFVPFVTIAF